MSLSDLTTPIPVYVTRKTARGVTGSFTIPGWIGVLAVILVMCNVVLWSGYGIYLFAATI